MPKLSPTMEEGQLSRWLKKEGDKVSVGEPIAEVDTDKATMEAQALTNGVLRKILVPEGSTVPLGAIIAIIADPDEDISGIVSEATSAEPKPASKESGEESSAGQAEAAPDKQAQATAKDAPVEGVGGGQPAETADAGADKRQTEPKQPPPSEETAQGNGRGAQAGGRLIVSPIAARMAAEAGLNLQTVAGSGPGGRIVKRDIEQAISRAGAQPEAAPQAEAPQAEQPRAAATAQTQKTYTAPTIEGASAYRDEPLSTMRATIAKRLVSSIGPVPHFFLTTEIEMDRAAELRRQLNELDPELKASINDLIIKVVAVALVQHPSVNASFQEKAIRYYERADIGVAVAVEDGLITPVIRSANTKSVGQISREVRELAERARARRLKPEEYTGATFSVSNLGMFGIDEFTAVINPPEAAILAVGAMQPKPVVRDGEVVVRQLMRVTMSCDHRVVDGATGAKFLQTFKKIMENPLYLIA